MTNDWTQCRNLFNKVATQPVKLPARAETARQLTARCLFMVAPGQTAAEALGASWVAATDQICSPPGLRFANRSKTRTNITNATPQNHLPWCCGSQWEATPCRRPRRDYAQRLRHLGRKQVISGFDGFDSCSVRNTHLPQSFIYAAAARTSLQTDDNKTAS